MILQRTRDNFRSACRKPVDENNNRVVPALVARRGVIALLAGSPAINGGDDAACPFTDQRGFGRVDVCDIGAFEFGGTAVSVKQGDVNCDDEVTAVDALFILRFVAGIPPVAECLNLASDVNCDGANTAVDALGVLRFVAGLPVNQNEPCADIGTPV